MPRRHAKESNTADADSDGMPDYLDSRCLQGVNGCENNGKDEEEWCDVTCAAQYADFDGSSCVNSFTDGYCCRTGSFSCDKAKPGTTCNLDIARGHDCYDGTCRWSWEHSCTPPSTDPDADSDGIPDAKESNTADADSDGMPDHLDPDSDGDGSPDAEEGTGECGMPTGYCGIPRSSILVRASIRTLAKPLSCHSELAVPTSITGLPRPIYRQASIML